MAELGLGDRIVLAGAVADTARGAGGGRHLRARQRVRGLRHGLRRGAGAAACRWSPAAPGRSPIWCPRPRGRWCRPGTPGPSPRRWRGCSTIRRRGGAAAEAAWSAGRGAAALGRRRRRWSRARCCAPRRELRRGLARPARARGRRRRAIRRCWRRRRSHLAGVAEPVALDLGCGTGAAVRALRRGPGAALAAGRPRPGAAARSPRRAAAAGRRSIAADLARSRPAAASRGVGW